MIIIDELNALPYSLSQIAPFTSQQNQSFSWRVAKRHFLIYAQ